MALTALLLSMSIAAVMVWLSWHLDNVTYDLRSQVEDLDHQARYLDSKISALHTEMNYINTITDNPNTEDQ